MERVIEAPKQLAQRQSHTRLFAWTIVLCMLVIRPSLAADSLLHPLLLLAGYVLVIAGVMGRVYCSAFIGQKNDMLLRTGPFSLVRNPLYVFSFIATFGVALQSCMITIFVLLCGGFALYYPQVVAREEAFLRHKFGDAFLTYMRDVPRWIPNFRGWIEPDQMVVRPRLIRRIIMDGTVFFLPFPCLVLLEALHAHHILPVWLTLP